MNSPMDALVVIMTVQPEILGWIAAISAFVSIAITSVVSPGRKWFELAVIFGICLLLNVAIVGSIVQWVAGVEVIHFEAIETVEQPPAK